MYVYFYNQGLMFEPENDAEWDMLSKFGKMLDVIKTGLPEEITADTGPGME